MRNYGHDIIRNRGTEELYGIEMEFHDAPAWLTALDDVVIGEVSCKVKADSSLERGAEVVTPPLSRSAMVRWLKSRAFLEWIRKMKSDGARVDNDTGMHMHYSNPKWGSRLPDVAGMDPGKGMHPTKAGMTFKKQRKGNAWLSESGSSHYGLVNTYSRATVEYRGYQQSLNRNIIGFLFCQFADWAHKEFGSDE